MPESNIPTSYEAFDDLMGERCSGCGGWKQSENSVCYRCWKRLPTKLARALYNRIGQGYEEALANARAFLQDRGRTFITGGEDA